MYGWYLDDGRSDGKHEVQVIIPLYKEPSPVGQVRNETYHDLDVERDGDDQLSNVENLIVHQANVRPPRRLKDERGKSEGYPTPPDIPIHLLHSVSSRFPAMRIDSGCPGLVLFVHDGLDAINKSLGNSLRLNIADHSRGSTERARSCLCSNSGKRIRDHGDEQIDKPKIEHDETSDEKEARYEELCVDHVVH